MPSLSFGLSLTSAQPTRMEKAGNYQRLRILEGPGEAESQLAGKEVINLASNNCRGFTTVSN